MNDMNTKKVLWINVLAIMDYHYGKENLSRFARETGCGPGTATRIKNMSTSVGIDVLEKIADRFKLQPWQLLTPNLDPANPPVAYLSSYERELYQRLKLAAESLAGFKTNNS